MRRVRRNEDGRGRRVRGERKPYGDEHGGGVSVCEGTAQCRWEIERRSRIRNGEEESFVRQVYSSLDSAVPPTGMGYLTFL